MRPEISVIIPCFNAEIYIPRCIEKLEQQTFKSFEVVIVDDCSSDNSVELLRKIEKKTSLECLIIELNKNSGPGNARNIGIENARGNYVSFCDIDDYYEPDFLKIMYEEIKNQNAEIMMCNSKLLFKDGSERKNSYTEIFDKYKEKEDYLALSRSSLCYLLVKKDLFNNISIPELRNGEDIAVIPLLMLKASKIGHINYSLYTYYVRENSASSKPTKKSFQDLVTCFSIIESMWTDSYSDALEFIGIKTLLYSAVLIGFKANVNLKQIKKQIYCFTIENPNWYKNRYLRTMSKRHSLFLKLVKYKMYLFLNMYAKFHSIVMK